MPFHHIDEAAQRLHASDSERRAERALGRVEASGALTKAAATFATALVLSGSSVSLTGQVGPVPPTSLLTSQNGGLYRVTAYTEIFDAPQCYSAWLPSFSWVDDVGRTKTTIEPIQNLCVVTRTQALRSAPGTDISYQIIPYSQRSERKTYNAYVTVEQLQ